jgi:secreted trypsin-like serine protease
MKVLVSTFLILFAASAYADDSEIDWSRVVPVQETPGFWDNKPAFYKEQYMESKSISGRNGRIVGGAVVAPNSIPFMVGLVMNNNDGGNSLCGASLITVRTTLTAAHCFWNFVITARSTNVIAGAHQIFANEPSQQRRLVQQADYRIHPQVDFSRGMNDVGLLLHTPFTLNNFVRLVTLPTAFRTDQFAGVAARVSGWGQTGAGQGTSTHLRAVNKSIMSNAQCAQHYGSHINPTVICTTAGNPISVCGGDSGGPVTIQRNGQIIQVGIVNFAGGNCAGPSGHNRVTSSLDWIERNRA